MSDFNSNNIKLKVPIHEIISMNNPLRNFQNNT